MYENKYFSCNKRGNTRAEQNYSGNTVGTSSRIL